MTTVAQPLNNGFQIVGKPKRIRARTHTHTHTHTHTRHPDTSPTPDAYSFAFGVLGGRKFPAPPTRPFWPNPRPHSHPLKGIFMNDLKNLNAQLAEVRRAQAGIAAKLGEIGAERHAVESASSDRAASIAVAEQALVDALAAHELGEPADVDGAQQRLNDARFESHSSIETATRLRVLDALRARHEGEHAAIHEKGLSIMAAIKRAETDAIMANGAALLTETEAAMATVARNACLLAACQSLAVERGASWPHAVLNEAVVAYRNQLTPNQARAEVLAALAA